MTGEAPRRILVHPGFHKTGTSSIQQFLWINRAALAPHLDLLMLRHLKPVARLCMSYARTGNPLFVVDLVEEMDAVLSGLSLAGRDLILSCEALSGHLPGWPGVADYAAAAVTVPALVTYLADRFPEAELRLACSTRAAGPWLDSAWRHHLMGQRLRLSQKDFADRFAAAADLGAALSAIAEAVAPVPVWDLPLDLGRDHPLGPGGLLLELLDLPADLREGLHAVPAANLGPGPALAAELLALNRSDLPDGPLKARKAALAEAAGLVGWTRLPPGGG